MVGSLPGTKIDKRNGETATSESPGHAGDSGSIFNTGRGLLLLLLLLLFCSCFLFYLVFLINQMNVNTFFHLKLDWPAEDGAMWQGGKVFLNYIH